MSKIEEKAFDYMSNLTEDDAAEPVEMVQKAFIEGADFALQHQWVSVDDALPPIQENVLVMTDECTDVAYREEDSIRFTGNMFDYDASQIIAWMPIPPLPEARKEGEG